MFSMGWTTRFKTFIYRCAVQKWLFFQISNLVMILQDVAKLFRWNLDLAQIEFYAFCRVNGSFKDSFTKRCALQNCVFLETLHLFMSLWKIVLVETWDLGWLRPPVRTNLNWFYIFQNRIIYDFGRILNKPAIFFLMQ